MKKLIKPNSILRAALLRSYFYFTVCALLCLTVSCESFIDTEPPASQLIGSSVFEDKATANAAMAGLYSKLRDSGILTGLLTGGSARLGLYADEFDYYEANGSNSFYNNSLVAADGGVVDMWNQSYNQIYTANAIIEGVGNSSALQQSDKDQLMGEALFVRALVHFYLVNMYGDVPYIRTTDYEQNTHVFRNDVQQVYELITTDLTEAVTLLPEDYPSADRVRPNKFAAYALLARAYLYSGQWAEAADTASAVINNSQYVWEDDLDKVFLKESTATIWQFMPSSVGNNTAEGQLFIFNAGPPLFVALNSSFISSFEQGDQRLVHWTKAVTDGVSTWHHAFKYKQDNNTGSSVEYSIVLRLAEQYLIRAEARARQGDIIGAKEDLNRTRNAAGLQDTVASTPEGLVEAILAERRFEFFTEFGHRFFDLKRLGRLDDVLGASKPGWEPTDSLWPIPSLELSVNPNLNPQNAGY